VYAYINTNTQYT